MAETDFFVNLDPDLQMQEPALRDLYAYWTKKRGDRQLPSRNDIDPLELGPYLPNIILIEVQAEPLRLRYRLVGTAITQAMQRDSTGRYYDEIYSEEVLDGIYRSFRWIIEHRAPLRTHGRTFYPDTNFYDYETLNLPLSRDGTTVNMVLGGLYFRLLEGLAPDPS